MVKLKGMGKAMGKMGKIFGKKPGVKPPVAKSAAKSAANSAANSAAAKPAASKFALSTKAKLAAGATTVGVGILGANYALSAQDRRQCSDYCKDSDNYPGNDDHPVCEPGKDHVQCGSECKRACDKLHPSIIGAFGAALGGAGSLLNTRNLLLVAVLIVVLMIIK